MVDVNEPGRHEAPDLEYPPLDQGVIGNGRVLALVAPTSAVDWLCMPRFDSPSVFGRLLDAEKGGTFRVLHRDAELYGELAYIPNTNVLSCRFEAEDGAWKVVDFAPRLPNGLGTSLPLQIVRLIRPISGQPKLSIDFDPQPDFARSAVELIPGTTGIHVLGGPHRFHLTTNMPVPYLLDRRDFALT
jgi:hypothetical protein